MPWKAAPATRQPPRHGKKVRVKPQLPAAAPTTSPPLALAVDTRGTPGWTIEDPRWPTPIAVAAPPDKPLDAEEVTEIGQVPLRLAAAAAAAAAAARVGNGNGWTLILLLLRLRRGAPPPPLPLPLRPAG